MHDKFELCATSAEKPLTAEDVLGLICLDDPRSIRETITNLFLDWIASEDEIPLSERSGAVNHFRILMTFFDNVENYHTERRAS